MRRTLWAMLAGSVLGTALTLWSAVGQSQDVKPTRVTSDTPPRPSSPPKDVDRAVPFYDGLGPHRRNVTTDSAEAQKYFDQGLAFLYGFNHDEAIRAFAEAARLDPRCAMAWWGISVANGPHINNPLMPEARSKSAWDALRKAQMAQGASPVEKELIDALSKRYAETPPEDRKPLDEAYAAAMREVWKRHPHDADIGALFAESMMDLRPWDLWTADHAPQPGTGEIVATLEAALTQSPNHPLALHLYIHAVEASAQPQKAIAPAERLRYLEPGLGHMLHMPSHIDVRTGRWKEAIAANARAIEADRQYRARSPQQQFYRIYMAHNRHMLAFAAMMRGQSQLAIETINEMVREMPEDWAKENPLLADNFAPMPIEVLIRFGKWDEVLAAPEPAEHLPLARTMRHCARAIALAAKGDVEGAREAQRKFEEARAKVPKESFIGNNPAADILGVAEALLEGEVLVRAGKMEAGLAQLREAVKREDKLRYSEPPDWIHPVRHALGATLLTDGLYAEAERVYREDLTKLPGNGWSLLGLSRALELQGKPDESVRIQFEEAWRDSDIRIRSSCLCQPGR